MLPLKGNDKPYLQGIYISVEQGLTMMVCIDSELSLTPFWGGLSNAGWTEAEPEGVKNSAVDLVVLIAPVHHFSAVEAMKSGLVLPGNAAEPLYFSIAVCDDPGETRFDLLMEADIDDCIVYQDNPNLFANKLKGLTRQILNRKHSTSALSNANQVAMSAMAMASDLGRVVNFIELADSAQSPAELAQRLLQCLQAFALEGSICIMGDSDKAWATSYQERLEYHKQAIDLASDRIVTHGKYILIKFNHVGILVANAPVADEDQMGRLRDSLAHIANVAEVKARNLILNDFLRQQHNEIMRIMSLVQRISHDSNVNMRHIMQRLSEDIAAEAVSSNLEEAQELRLLKLSDDALQSLEDMHKLNDTLEDYLGYMIENIEQAREKAMTANPPVAATAPPSSDIELF